MDMGLFGMYLRHHLKSTRSRERCTVLERRFCPTAQKGRRLTRFACSASLFPHVRVAGYLKRHRQEAGMNADPFRLILEKDLT